ncbi:hypothetical protein [Pseudorhodoferax sp.]|uniref:hypothetical protein n=1 Tax=Pseudorhodoferax sp. TaxID=1993553 RepID=UPI0039E225E9
MQPWFALDLALGIAALAAVVGMLVGHGVPLGLLQEDGPVERATIWAYLAAVLALPMLRWPGMPRRDTIAACVLLLALAAREADLHKAMFGISILKSRFYLHGALDQILAALGVLLPIACAGLWLAVRHGRRWLGPPARWSAPVATVAVLVGTMVFAKVLDRTPETLGQLHLREHLPQAALYVMLALEEILELALPVLALLAILQCRWLALHANAAR